MYAKNEITKEQLNDLFLKNVKELEKELNLVALNVAIHYDEKTPHAHIMYKTYDNKNKSVSNDLKKQFSKAQDICGKVWSYLGFERGQKKQETNAKHLKVCEMHQKEIDELKKEKKEVKTEKQQIINYAKKQAQSILENSKGVFFVDYDKLQNNIEKSIKKALFFNSNLKENETLQQELKELKQQQEIKEKEHQKNDEITKNYLENFKKQNIDLYKTNQQLETTIQTLENNLEVARKRIKTYEINLTDNNYLKEKIIQNEKEIIKTTRLS